MENKIKVSVVVPAYNAGKVIQDCMSSLLKQSLKEIEIIAIDDGSTDNTRSILKEYQNLDSRIRLVEKDKNEGLSAARNSAIEIARGEYIGFVDADDWVEEDYFESMYSEGRHADLIVTGYQHDSMDETREKLYISRSVSMESGYWNEKKKVVSMAADIDSGKMFAYTWNKLYKVQIIKEEQLLFTKQVFIEDFIFNTQYWNFIQSLCIIEKTGYHYIKASKEALTQKFLPDFLEIMDIRYDHIKNLMVMNGVFDESEKAQLANIYIKHAISGVARNCAIEGHYTFSEQYRHVKKLLKNSRSIEASKYAKGISIQEKICNIVYKSRIAIAVLCFGKVIYAMQTKSTTAFDKMK